MKKNILLSAILLLGYLISDGREVIVSGKVLQQDGKPVAGAVVSDGISFTTTSNKGTYTLKSETSMTYCVFVVASSQYEVMTDNYGKFNGYALLDDSSSRQKCDFTLTKLPAPAYRHSVVFEGDPQSMSSRPHSGKSWEWVVDRLHEYGQTFTWPVYHIILGDMVTNEMEVPGMADKFISSFNRIGMKTLFVIGNHDHIHSAKTFHEATGAYAKYFGPYNYAMNIGGVHYIFLDSCAWGEGKKSYLNGFNDETVAFLEGDLAFVPKDTPVMICTHCPVTQTLDGEYPHLVRTIRNYDRFVKALQGRKVNLWYGHTHLTAQNAYTDEELEKYAPGVLSLDSHLVGRVGGAWSCSGEITMDGSPRGVVVADVDNKDVSWHYKSLEQSYPEDFNVYVPGMFENGDSTLYCNVYLWDEKWGMPQWYENGVLVGEMAKKIESKDAAHDPLYVYLYDKWVAAGLVDLKVRPEPSKPSYCNHLFYIMPSKGVRSGEVRVTDRFGRTVSRKVEW